jgi:cytochrome P450
METLLHCLRPPMVAGRDEYDFATEVAARIPLAVISHMFRIPRTDWELMFRLSNTMVDATDPKYSGGGLIERKNSRRALARDH